MGVAEFKKYTVKVGGGSGVIFQPMTNSYTYILTAKHNLQNEVDEGKGKKYRDKDNGTIITISIINYDLSPIEFVIDKGENYFPHENKDVDIAILKMEYIPGYDSICIDNSYKDISNYFICGFPNSLRINVELSDKYTDYEVDRFVSDNVTSCKSQLINDRMSHEDIIGMSGCGILKRYNNHVLIAGIQSKVTSLLPNGQVDFVPIKYFEDLINSNADKLSSLLPMYLASFSFLKDDVFQLPSDLITGTIISKITLIFESKIKEVINCDYTPNCIKDFLGAKQLLIYGQEEGDLYYKSLWLVWLELLTVLNVVKNKRHARSDFDSIFKHVRLLHSNGKNDFWVDHIDNIAKTNFGNLSKDGLVVVSSRRTPHRDHYILDPDTIIDQIDRIRFEYESNMEETPYGEEQDNITSASNFPFDNYRFVHIEYFKQKSLIDEYADYTKMNLTQILDKIRSKYEQVIK